MKAIAEFLKVLGDEARISMLWLLARRADVCVCDFMAVLDCTQSKASRHLRTLLHAGLVSHRRVGQWSHYSLRPVRDRLAASVVRTLCEGFGARRDAGRLLAKLDASLAAKGRRIEGNCR